MNDLSVSGAERGNTERGVEEGEEEDEEECGDCCERAGMDVAVVSGAEETDDGDDDDDDVDGDEKEEGNEVGAGLEDK